MTALLFLASAFTISKQDKNDSKKTNGHHSNVVDGANDNNEPKKKPIQLHIRKASKDNIHPVLHLSTPYLLFLHGLSYHENWKTVQLFKIWHSVEFGCTCFDHFCVLMSTTTNKFHHPNFFQWLFFY